MTNDEDDVEALFREVLNNPAARCAYQENELRRAIAASIEDARQSKGLTVRALAKAMETSVSQVQRLLHEDLGGSITLRTLCRAADVLDCRFGVHFRAIQAGRGCVVPFGTSAWTGTQP